ncbi:MAG: SDR family NAD(P)-dependent oxidoreductase [Rubrobacteraceae bacterium]|nr:SDR family NAD(P)-dependent oxidoreductase [Rubrobacteraceae bacterium]
MAGTAGTQSIFTRVPARRSRGEVRRASVGCCALANDTNVLGLLYTTDAAIETMKRQGSGHLVNISSVAGRKVTRDSSGVYAGSKFAVGAISEGLRQELLEDNIRVTIVEPGAVETELADHITDEDARQSLGGLLNLEILQAEDIANAIVYAVTQPERVSVNEILIRPTQQPV